MNKVIELFPRNGFAAIVALLRGVRLDAISFSWASESRIRFFLATEGTMVARFDNWRP
jgi:hypothetical protein